MSHDKTKRKAEENGIVNPRGLLWAASGPGFLAAVPLTSYMTAPGGVMQNLVEAAVRLVPGTANIPQDRIIPALSALYLFVTFAQTGAISVAGLASVSKEGLDNNHPRKHVNELEGLPLRMRSAHYNLMEQFPAFVLAAALTQVLAPKNQQLLNLLGLHVISKVFLHYPCYLLNVAPPRSIAHILATGSVINVAYRLALGEK